MTSPPCSPVGIPVLVFPHWSKISRRMNHEGLILRRNGICRSQPRSLQGWWITRLRGFPALTVLNRFRVDDISFISSLIESKEDLLVINNLKTIQNNRNSPGEPILLHLHHIWFCSHLQPSSRMSIGDHSTNPTWEWSGSGTINLFRLHQRWLALPMMAYENAPFPSKLQYFRLRMKHETNQISSCRPIVDHHQTGVLNLWQRSWPPHKGKY